MHFHPIEACGLGFLSSLAESRDDAGEFIIAKFTRDDVRLITFGGVDFVTGDRDGAGGHRLRTLIKQGMAGASAMPDLEEDSTPGGMYQISNFLPTDDLSIGVNMTLNI